MFGKIFEWSILVWCVSWGCLYSTFLSLTKLIHSNGDTSLGVLTITLYSGEMVPAPLPLCQCLWHRYCSSWTKNSFLLDMGQHVPAQDILYQHRSWKKWVSSCKTQDEKQGGLIVRHLRRQLWWEGEQRRVGREAGTQYGFRALNME